jgi:uncharacterized protein (DUF342 family)
VIVEAWSLADCRREAAARLGVLEDAMEVQVLQEFKRGLFTCKPCRIKAWVRKAGGQRADAQAAPSGGSKFLDKLNVHVQVAVSEMAHIEAIRDEREGQVFDEIVSGYDDLSENLRREVQDLSKLLSGAGAQKVQDRVAKDGLHAITVSDDRMQAFLRATPPEGVGRPVTAAAVEADLKRRGIVYGLQPGRLRQALQEVIELGQPLEQVCVAEGYPPQDGRDGRVEFLVRPAGKEVIVRSDGSIDHRGQAGITVVRCGQVLARLVPHTAGETGMDVYGRKLESRAGRPARLSTGKNVLFDEESGEFRSAIDGVLEMAGGTVLVKQAYAVPGDVDMTVGNIEFNGSVTVGGTVRDGFAVHASGDILIHGGVEACEIISERGTVKVLQGVAGRGRCFISAGRNVEAKYIENARVYARGSVRVEVAVMHSEVSAGDSVIAISGKGAIIGGTTKATNLVHAFSLGAPNEPPTDFIIGISDEDQSRIRNMDRNLAGLNRAAARFQELAAEFERASREVDALPAAEKEKYVELRKKLVVLHYEIEKAEKQRADFLEAITAEATGEVRASREAYPRVAVRIGQYRDRLERRLNAVSFRVDLEEEQIVRSRA